MDTEIKKKKSKSDMITKKQIFNMKPWKNDLGINEKLQNPEKDIKYIDHHSQEIIIFLSLFNLKFPTNLWPVVFLATGL